MTGDIINWESRERKSFRREAVMDRQPQSGIPGMFQGTGRMLEETTLLWPSKSHSLRVTFRVAVVISAWQRGSITQAGLLLLFGEAKFARAKLVQTAREINKDCYYIWRWQVFFFPQILSSHLKWLTVEICFTSNHLRIPGKVYAVVYVVRSIHIVWWQKWKQ